MSRGHDRVREQTSRSALLSSRGHGASQFHGATVTTRVSTPGRHYDDGGSTPDGDAADPADTLCTMSLPQPPTITHCYRHPDRETGRSCTRCGKPACSECLVQASVGSHCVDCRNVNQPDLKTRVRYASAGQPTLVTQVIIAINVAIFFWMAAKDSSSLAGSGHVTQQQFDLGLNRIVLSQTHEWYRLVTSGFIHFGFIHVGFNMYILWQLGQMLERTLGRAQFALLYMASLLGGSAGVLLLTDRGISGGASGAVFGLMAALAISMHRQGLNILQTGVGRLLMLNLVLTFVIPGIAIGGHLGGVAAGALCGTIMLAPKWKPMPTWAKYATPLAVSAIAVVISVVVVGSVSVIG